MALMLVTDEGHRCIIVWMFFDYVQKLKSTVLILFLTTAMLLLCVAGFFLHGKNTGAEDIVSTPTFSKTSGFYNDPFKLEIYCGKGEEIRYTLDCSEPTLDSPLYVEPIDIYDRSQEENLYSNNIFTSVDYFSYSDRHGYVLPEKPVDKCTVVRAVVFNENGEKSETVTESFFIGYQNKPSYRGTGVISLTADPDDLFGYENGIYVIGKLGTEDFQKNVAKSEEAQAYLKENPDTPLDGTVQIGNVYMHEAYVYNYSQGGIEWERPADIAFFDMWHTKLASGKLGIRIRGNNSRNFPQKSLSLFERETYAKEELYFPFLKNNIKSGIALSGGGDDMYSFTRDPFLAELYRKNGLAFGVQEISEPVFLFLNGEFWGTYLLTEKEDKQYLERHYGVDEDNTLIVKNGILDSGTPERYRKYYGELVEYVINNDLSTENGYKGFSDLVDMKSLIDYYCARIYVDDTSDWPKSNVAVWRSVNKTDRPYEDGKWRFLNFDNNIELQASKVDFDTIGSILSQGKEDYEDMKEEYESLVKEGKDLEEMLDEGLRFDRMILYPLFQNEKFREEFMKRFTEIEDSVYEPEEAIKLLDSIAYNNRLPVVTGYSRWFGERCSFKDFDEKIEEIRFFLRNRRQYIDGYMKEASY